MLVLTRKEGEGVIIGTNIKVSVIEVKGKHVRFGIEAPSNMEIYRNEVYERILEENKLAASPDTENLKDLIKSFGKK